MSDSDRVMLDECAEAFRAMKTAADARRFMKKRLLLVPGAYAGDGRQLLADEMFRRISVHRAAPPPQGAIMRHGGLKMAIEPPHVSINDEELLVEWFGRVIIVVNDEGAACCFVRQGHYVPHTAVDWPTALAELRRLIDAPPTVGGMEVE